MYLSNSKIPFVEYHQGPNCELFFMFFIKDLIFIKVCRIYQNMFTSFTYLYSVILTSVYTYLIYFSDTHYLISKTSSVHIRENFSAIIWFLQNSGWLLRNNSFIVSFKNTFLRFRQINDLPIWTDFLFLLLVVDESWFLPLEHLYKRSCIVEKLCQLDLQVSTNTAKKLWLLSKSISEHGNSKSLCRAVLSKLGYFYLPIIKKKQALRAI